VEISGSLTRSFRARARVGVALPGDPDELERLLAQRYEEARAPWPGVALPADEFVSHVAERLPEEGEGAPVGEVLDSLRLSDLYLACACARRVPAADAALEREFLARLPGLLRRQYSRAPEATIDDACQAVREKLLLGNPPGQPHLLTYGGEGALMVWTRVIAVRTLSKLMHREADPPGGDFDPFPLEIQADVDVEGDAIKNELSRKFREVVREAVRAVLTQEERHLFKLHYKDGVSTVKLARYFDVPQANMWRRLDRSREKILAESKRLMREKYGIEGEGLASLISGLESRFDVTLSSIFDSDAG